MIYFLLVQCFGTNLDYDFNLLSIDWKPVVCFSRNDKCVPSYKSNNFTIHGLWPSKIQGKHPQFCKTNQNPFNITPSTNAMLDQYWKSYNINQENFWVHEWTKHGTCLNNEISSEEYFKKTIELFKKVDPQKTLRAASIIPRNDQYYSLKKILNSFNNTVSIKCHLKKQISYLLTINFCFDKELSIINCTNLEIDKKCKHAIAFPLFKD